MLAFALLGTFLVPVSAEAARRRLGSRLLEQPMRGTDVRVLQDFLTRLGYRATVDGHFGKSTSKALRKWERAAGQRADGRLTVRESRVLRNQVEDGVGPGSEDAATDRTDGGAAAGETTSSTTKAEKATLTPDGLHAIAPESAPPEVKAFIDAANKIATKPYKYGGGHGDWEDSGYDCSGSMSYALHGAGLLDEPLDSTGFMSYGDSGPGKWMTIYAHGGHSYMMVAGLRFDTSGRHRDGTRWHDSKRSADGYTVRHVPGF